MMILVLRHSFHKLILSICSAGIKIVQQIAILMGCAVLPHLKALVEIVEGGLEDEQQKVCLLHRCSVFTIF